MSFTSISDSAMSANCLSISICSAVLRPSTLFEARLLRMHVFGRVCVCVHNLRIHLVILQAPWLPGVGSSST